MKRFLIPCVLLFLALSAYPHALGQTNDLQQRTKTFRNSNRFKVAYDRFTDETRVTVGPFYPKHKFVEMEARFFFKGKQPTDAITEVYFVLRSYGREWRFLNNRTLYGIINGERIEFGEGERNSHIQVSGVSESLRFTIPMELFKKIATAKSVELKVSSVEFPLNDEHLAAFRDLLSLTEAATP